MILKIRWWVFRSKLLAAQSRHKKYTYNKVRDVLFQTDENVILKVSPVKGMMRFGMKGKLSPWYIITFEVFQCRGPVEYRLVLTPNLSDVHPVFNVIMLKRYHGYGDYIIMWDSIVLHKDLQYKKERILDRDRHKLRTKEIKLWRFNGRIILLRKLPTKPRDMRHRDQKAKSQDC